MAAKAAFGFAVLPDQAGTTYSRTRSSRSGSTPTRKTRLRDPGSSRLPLQDARGGFALTAGLFDKGGYTEVKPAIVLAPSIALEPYVGIVLSTEGRRFLYGGGGTLNFAPDWPIAPYVHLGAGNSRPVANKALCSSRRHRRALAQPGWTPDFPPLKSCFGSAMQVVLFEPGLAHQQTLRASWRGSGRISNGTQP